MLIEFKVSNFRSIRDVQTLSLVADRMPEHRQTNTFAPEILGFERLLRSSVIYGPNASGKTNLLRAVQVLQGMVINSAGNVSTYVHTPFKFAVATRSEPTNFQITFAQDGTRYEYALSIDAERVTREWLSEYVHPRGRTIFDRKYNKRSGSYEWHFSSFFKGQRSLWSESTRPNALFLSTAVQLNSKQLLPVFEWFQKRLVVIVGITTMNPSLTLRLLERPDGKGKLLPFLREADLGIADLDVRRELIPPGAVVLQAAPHLIEQLPGELSPSLVQVTFSHWTDTAGENVPLDFADESSGTQVLFRSAGAWLNVFENGEVLLFDEIDTSLHPLLTQFLVRRFHSDAINKQNSQLIFTTHNTSHLQKEMFRRDQVWFVEKERCGASKLYPLTDFSPRNDESLERGYMRGRYGAIPILGDPHV
jgi:uncharacterized protein